VVSFIFRRGLVGEDGPTHHGVFDIAYLRHIPNMTLMAPKDENELRKMLWTALHHPGPVAVRYPRGEALGVPLDSGFDLLPIGKAELILEGREIVFLAYGSMVSVSQKAVEILRREGIDAGLVNMRFAKPLDKPLLLQMAHSTSLLVTVEEGTVLGGLGSAVLEFLSAEDLLGRVRVRLAGIPDHYVEHGAPGILRDSVGLTPEHLVELVRKNLQTSVC
jgi:1-deoxy-D-xylulose-5-phosphate synthase